MSDGAPWYRLLDHTGDIAILVRAESSAGLVDATVRALFDVITDVRSIEPRDRMAVAVRGSDREDTLVRFLSELLFLHDARDRMFRGAEEVRFEPTSLEASVTGEPFDPVRHRIERQVKAVTYHEALVSEDADGWSARVVLDL